MELRSTKFFDTHRVLYPWPDLLRRTGFRYQYKLREVFWRRQLDQVGFKKGMRVLDVGCGRGEFLDRLMTEYGVEGSGIDLSVQSIDEAKRKMVNPAQLKAGSATKLPFGDEEFDVVVSFDTLEHVENQTKAVGEMARVVKLKGKVVVYTV
ncbi:class I SAM-dependent methyltransferase, partial [Patescibacteria group bacterium]|nr:class I SAM-dependent methyltransferase [Patescibacteria group bacterium]